MAAAQVIPDELVKSCEVPCRLRTSALVCTPWRRASLRTSGRGTLRPLPFVSVWLPVGQYPYHANERYSSNVRLPQHSADRNASLRLAWTCLLYVQSVSFTTT